MTTARQVKEILAPFLALHPDLVLSGRWILVPPVNHVAAYILIDRTSDPDLFTVQWGGAHLFGPHPGIDLMFQVFLYPKRPLWLLSDPATQDDLTEKLDSIVPALRAIRTIDGYWDFANGPRVGYHKISAFFLRAMIVQIAMGNLAYVREVFDEVEAGETELGRTGRMFLREEAMLALMPLVKAGDRQGLAELLHRWEQASGAIPILRRLWQPTPFPLELTGT